MNNRIKELRKSLGLNQTEFGARIGIKQTTVAGYENGRAPLDTVVTSICREFNVNRLWLETGEGPMLRPEPAADTLAGAIADIIGHDDPLAVAVMTSLAQMPPNWWEAWREKLVESLPPETGSDERGELTATHRQPIGFVGYPDDRKAKKGEGNGF